MPIGQTATARGSVGDDWTFAIHGLAGSTLFRIGKLPPGWVLKAVMLDGRDLTDTPLALEGTEDIRGLQIVVSNRTTEVSGSVADAKGRPVPEQRVVFADDATKWTWPSRFVATSRPAQDGRFRFSNLPAGTYLAVAVQYLEDGQEQDPEFLEAVRARATRFTLAEGRQPRST